MPIETRAACRRREAQETLLRWEADCPVRGLQNAVGDNLCFLNSALQLLLACMPELCQQTAAQGSAGGSVVKAVSDLASRYQSANLGNDGLTTRPVQTALHDAVSQRGFAAGQMNDVAEALAALLDNMAADVATAASATIRRLAGFEEQVTWRCVTPTCDASVQATSCAFVRAAPVFPILFAEASPPRASSHSSSDVEIVVPTPRCGRHRRTPEDVASRSFASYAGRFDSHEARSCDVCGQASPTRAIVAKAPLRYAAVQLVWYTTRPAAADLDPIFTAIEPQTSLAEIFGTEPPEAPQTAALTGLVLFRGEHYVVACRGKEPHSTAWWIVNDERVQYVAPTWCGLVAFLRAGRWAPMLLLYDASRAVPADDVRVVCKLRPAPRPRNVRDVLRAAADETELAPVDGIKEGESRGTMVQTVVNVAGVSREVAERAVRRCSRRPTAQAAVNYIYEECDVAATPPQRESPGPNRRRKAPAATAQPTLDAFITPGAVMDQLLSNKRPPSLDATLPGVLQKQQPLACSPKVIAVGETTSEEHAAVARERRPQPRRLRVDTATAADKQLAGYTFCLALPTDAARQARPTITQMGGRLVTPRAPVPAKVLCTPSHFIVTTVEMFIQCMTQPPATDERTVQQLLRMVSHSPQVGQVLLFDFVKVLHNGDTRFIPGEWQALSDPMARSVHGDMTAL